MQTARKASPLRGFLLFLLGCLVGANATYLLMTRQGAAAAPVVTATKAPPVAGELPTAGGMQHDTGPLLPPPVASMRGTPLPSASALIASSNGLLIPVQGITASQLSDTFTDARSADRLHDAIDIMAPAGTPVLAVADGHAEKLFTSKLGGLTLYQFNQDGTLAYYYAHLQRYADGLAEQQQIRRGQVIGYVGATGNANPEAPHLHFAIFVLGPEKQWWKGDAVNPYPRLTGTGAAQ